MSVLIDPGEIDCVCGCVMAFMVFLVYFQDNNHEIIRISNYMIACAYTDQNTHFCVITHHTNVTATNQTLTISLLSTHSLDMPIVSLHAPHSLIQ